MQFPREIRYCKNVYEALLQRPLNWKYICKNIHRVYQILSIIIQYNFTYLVLYERNYNLLKMHHAELLYLLHKNTMKCSVDYNNYKKCTLFITWPTDTPRILSVRL
jgi:hypothetical protein